MQLADGTAMTFAGHAMTRADALTQARADLVAAGMDAFTADTLLIDHPGLVVQAWFDDTAGFVQADYPAAQPVTVVNVQIPTQ